MGIDLDKAKIILIRVFNLENLIRGHRDGRLVSFPSNTEPIKGQYC